MKLSEAIEIVLQLAEQNAIQVEEAGNDQSLVREAHRQEDALLRVQKWVEDGMPGDDQ